MQKPTNSIVRDSVAGASASLEKVLLNSIGLPHVTTPVVVHESAGVVFRLAVIFTTTPGAGSIVAHVIPTSRTPRASLLARGRGGRVAYVVSTLCVFGSIACWNMPIVSWRACAAALCALTAFVS